MLRKVLLLGSLLILFGIIQEPLIVKADEGDGKQGPASDSIFFQSFHVDRAPVEIQQNRMDLYLYGVRPDAADSLKDEEEVVIYESPASSISLILNPAPGPDGELNPFSIKNVRQGIQFLINREFVASSIYRGRALPMITHVSPLDFDYLILYQQIKESTIKYDPGLGIKIIHQAMNEAGAKLVNGVWHYNDQPIRIKFIIRVEDERRDVGDLVRIALQDAGFKATAMYQNFAPAIQTVYSSNPNSMEWHIYTEGWSRASPDRYDFSNINQMTAPWMGNMPGWRAAGFWQYENPELDALGKKIFTGQFSTKDERDQFYKKATQIALDESVRIWIGTILNSFPASRKLEGMTEDLVAGPRSPWALREAYIAGSRKLTVGNLWVWTERSTWNPIGGFSDVYSQDIWRNITDPPLWNHPFSGMPIPFRSSYTVDTNGPLESITVPEIAVTLDPIRNRWVPVGKNITAKSKVVFDYSKYFQSNWHHGSPITMADVVYSIFQTFDMAFDPSKSEIETSIAMTSKPFLETFKGFKVLDENRLEVYVDFWHFEDGYIASYANPTSLSMPWEILHAMDTLVFQQRRGAYSDTAAIRYNVPWLSLVMARDARLVRNTLLDFKNQESETLEIFNINGFNLSNLETRTERYNAALNWWDKYEMMVIGNGPFQLIRFDPPAQFAELKAFRDESYPFSAGQWQFGKAELPQIRNVSEPSLKIGEEYNVSFDITGSGVLMAKYILSDPVSGQTIIAGNANKLSSTQFEITIDQSFTRDLFSGFYHLNIIGFSDRISSLSEYRVDLVPDNGKTIQLNYNPDLTEEPSGPTSGCGRSPSGTLPLILAGLGLFSVSNLWKIHLRKLKTNLSNRGRTIL